MAEYAMIEFLFDGEPVCVLGVMVLAFVWIWNQWMVVGWALHVLV